MNQHDRILFTGMARTQMDAIRERVCHPAQLELVLFLRTAGVAQLVERWIVIPVVEGSNPFARPSPGSHFLMFYTARA